ncbi:MAG: serine--tRNA ligase, partial [Candidatus Competibacterales bacterium]|nr:serine--tRNA ligase [Candidatus Competibacterales bacterium]
MLDSKLLRQQLQETARLLTQRGYTLDTHQFDALEADRKRLQVRTEELRQERNRRSKEIGQAKAAGQDIAPLKQAVGELGNELEGTERELEAVQARLEALQLEIPNLAHASVPVGDSEDDNAEQRRWGEPPTFDFDPRDHVELGAQGLDFDKASKLTGARFVVIDGALARLHRALAQFMLDLHTQDHGYREVMVPF